MSNIGIKVAKDGDNIFTADNKELRFNSNVPLTGIQETGEYSYTMPANTPVDGTKVNILSHDYGYKPLCLGFYSYQADSKKNYFPLFEFIHGTVQFVLYLQSDSSNVFLKWVVGDDGPVSLSGDDLLIKYYILTK